MAASQSAAATLYNKLRGADQPASDKQIKRSF